MVMVAKLTRLTHKIAIHLHLMQRAVTFAVLVPGSQFGNFWVHPRINHPVLSYNSLSFPSFGGSAVDQPSFQLQEHQIIGSQQPGS